MTQLCKLAAAQVTLCFLFVVFFLLYCIQCQAPFCCSKMLGHDHLVVDYFYFFLHCSDVQFTCTIMPHRLIAILFLTTTDHPSLASFFLCFMLLYMLIIACLSFLSTASFSTVDFLYLKSGKFSY